MSCFLYSVLSKIEIINLGPWIKSFSLYFFSASTGAQEVKVRVSICLSVRFFTQSIWNLSVVFQQSFIILSALSPQPQYLCILSAVSLALEKFFSKLSEPKILHLNNFLFLVKSHYSPLFPCWATWCTHPWGSQCHCQKSRGSCPGCGQSHEPSHTLRWTRSWGMSDPSGQSPAISMIRPRKSSGCCTRRHKFAPFPRSDGGQVGSVQLAILAKSDLFDFQISRSLIWCLYEIWRNW